MKDLDPQARQDGDYALAIDVATRYLDEQSEPGQDRYVFSYTIHIRNAGRVPARLLGRHWVITDANGKVEEVVGDGVVGEQPWLRPGEDFEYTSGAILETQLGTMQAKNLEELELQQPFVERTLRPVLDLVIEGGIRRSKALARDDAKKAAR